MTPTANTYFSGAGLMDLGLEQAGIEILSSFEIDPKACDTQRLNFSANRVRQCDLTTKLVGDEQRPDIRVFTYPCTKYSSAADIQQSRTGDELYLHALRHMVIDPPEAFVAENVPGMRKFPVVMEAMTRLPDYYVHVICPVSASTWVPQQRDRLIIIGTRRYFLFEEPTGHRVERLSDIIEHDPRVEIPEYVYKRLDGAYRDRPIISDPEAGDIAPTCVAHYAKDRSTRLVRDQRFPRGVRPYTVREYARLQGVHDSFRFSGADSDAYRQIGNGVAVPVARWVGQQLMRYFNN